jgi:predicted methyltransferase
MEYPMNILHRLTLKALAVALMAAVALPAPAEGPSLSDAVHNPKRSEKFVKRDVVRHPVEELEFFGLRPEQTVVEVSPGGGYWTEILAPFLHEAGTYYVAVSPPGDPEAPKPGKDVFRDKLHADPGSYGKVQLTELGKGHYDVAPAGTADVVLTFRNLHNWLGDGYADQALAAFFRALKPGGILGIEDHRARDDKPQEPKADSGYVRQDYAIHLVQQAGFEFVGSSEVNANPRDTKDWPKGVWTLPPTLKMGDTDRAKYMSIGEADNFVLKFRKPGH